VYKHDIKKEKYIFILNMNYIENYIEMQQMRNSVFQLVFVNGMLEKRATSLNTKALDHFGFDT